MKDVFIVINLGSIKMKGINYNKIDLETIDELIRHMKKQNGLFLALGSLEFMSKKIKSGTS